MWILYQAAVALALLAVAPVLLARRRRHYLPTLRQRLGFYGTSRAGVPSGGHSGERNASGGDPARDGIALDGTLWIHAVSVGEVAVAATFARTLAPEQRLVVTTVTATGQARARAAFAGRSAEIAYLPFDLGFAVGRFFRRFRPAALVLVEGDYWPLVLRACRVRKLPVVVINGRVGMRSFGRWKRIRSVWRAFHQAVTRFGVQTRDDHDRLLALGAAPEAVTITGNLKFETVAPVRNKALESTINAIADGRPIIIAGSTMQGEDAQVLDAFIAAGGGAAALLILVPRHPERWDPAAEQSRSRGLRTLRRSSLGGEGSCGTDRPDVLLLDSIGELAALYGLAQIAFIGGTLSPTGGHNPLEASHFRVPVVVGPSMFNFREMAAAFDREQAWRRVECTSDLGRAF